MAYGCGYADGYNDTCEIIINVCAPLGWGGGPYGVQVYGGYEICSLEIDEIDLPTPRSNVRELCIVRCT